MSQTIGIASGSVYLSAEVCASYFRGIDSVAILIRDRTIRILPVHKAAAGGCLLKIRNSAGDRVASAPDVFLENDLCDLQADALPAHWSSDLGALVVKLPFEEL